MNISKVESIFIEVPNALPDWFYKHEDMNTNFLEAYLIETFQPIAKEAQVTIYFNSISNCEVTFFDGTNNIILDFKYNLEDELESLKYSQSEMVKRLVS